MKKNLLFTVAGIAALALAGQVQAATVSLGLDTPIVGDGILNTAISADDANNVNGGPDEWTYLAHDRSAQGQTFTTGSNAGGYLLNSVSLQHANYGWTWCNINDATLFNVRIVSMTDSGLNVLHTESADPGFALDVPGWVQSAGEWFTFTLDTAQVLAPNTVYGFDIDSTNANGAWGYMETGGTITDSIAGGNAYTMMPSGAHDVANTQFQAHAGDRAFAANMTAIAVPEPASILAMLSGLVGLAGYSTRRRK